MLLADQAYCTAGVATQAKQPAPNGKSIHQGLWHRYLQVVSELSLHRLDKVGFD